MHFQESSTSNKEKDKSKLPKVKNFDFKYYI